MIIWKEDKETGIQIGRNDDGELFLGDNKSSYNLPDTEENRRYILNDFYRYTGNRYNVESEN